MSTWPKVLLQDIARLVRGTEPGSESYTDATKGIRFIRVGDITGKSEKPVFTDSQQLVMVSKNDLLIALDGTPGYVSTGHEGAISSGIRKIDSINTSDISQEWLRYSLMSHDVQETIKRYTNGVTILHASSAVPHIRIPVPPLSEQKRIGQLLNKAEALRSLHTQVDERMVSVTPALFHKMFGTPSSNSGNWKTVTLGSLGRVVTGNTPPRSESDFYGDYIEWIKTDNIDGIRGVVGRSAEGLSKIGARRARIVPEGSVLVNCIAGTLSRIGESAITDRKVAINQQINAIVPNKGVESAFLCSLVRELKPVIQANATGVMTRIINKSALEQIPAINPPQPLQKRFAESIAEIRRLEVAQSASQRRLDDLFNSLLHRAIWGEL
jgi:type I restriction enzyme S subunit